MKFNKTYLFIILSIFLVKYLNGNETILKISKFPSKY